MEGTKSSLSGFWCALFRLLEHQNSIFAAIQSWRGRVPVSVESEWYRRTVFNSRSRRFRQTSSKQPTSWYVRHTTSDSYPKGRNNTILLVKSILQLMLVRIWTSLCLWTGSHWMDPRVRMPRALRNCHGSNSSKNTIRASFDQERCSIVAICSL